jgi:hypothetical protein
MLTTKRILILSMALTLLLAGMALQTTSSAKASGPTARESVTVAQASKQRVAARKLQIGVTGKLPGKKAKIRVKGLKGKTKSFDKTFKVKKSKVKKGVVRPGKTVKLKPGKYKVTAPTVTKGGVRYVGKVSPRKIEVSNSKGAQVTVKFKKGGSAANSPATPVRVGPTNLRIDDVTVGGKPGLRAQWDPATGGTLRSYRAHYSLSSGSGPWSSYNPKEPFTASSISGDVCSQLPSFYNHRDVWGYITAVFTDGQESAPSNVVRYRTNCP